jgi:hypothetical protein
LVGLPITLNAGFYDFIQSLQMNSRIVPPPYLLTYHSWLSTHLAGNYVTLAVQLVSLNNPRLNKEIKIRVRGKSLLNFSLYLWILVCLFLSWMFLCSSFPYFSVCLFIYLTSIWSFLLVCFFTSLLVLPLPFFVRFFPFSPSLQTLWYMPTRVFVCMCVCMCVGGHPRPCVGIRHGSTQNFPSRK